MAGNREQIEYWNGPRGESWVVEQELRDRELAPFGAAALTAAAPTPGERVLDIGCGCGASSLALAEAVGRAGQVLGIDVSQPMLARAQMRGAGLPHLRFEHADAATATFAQPATLLFSRFGVMFFDDPGAAFANLRRAAAAGGRLVFVCWRGLEENPWLGVPFAAARQVVAEIKPPAPPDAPGPMAFADPARVRTILERAGFLGATLAPFDCAMRLGERGGIEAAAAEAVTLGPTARLLVDADSAAQARALDAVRRALTPYATGNEVQLGAGAWVVQARVAG